MDDNRELIRVLDKRAVDTVGLIDDYYSLTWTERYFEAGDFELELPISYDQDNIIKIGNYLSIDDSTAAQAMLIENIRPYNDGDKTALVVSGHGAEYLLHQRMIPDVQTRVGTSVEDLMQLYIQWHASNCVDTDRIIPQIYNVFQTPTITTPYYEVIGEINLYDLIVQMAKATGVGWKLTWQLGGFLFIAYEGLNRSWTQSPVVNNPVIFSDVFDNVISSSFYMSQGDTANLCRVLCPEEVTYTDVDVWEEGKGEPIGIDRHEMLLTTQLDRYGVTPPLDDAGVLQILQVRGRAELNSKKMRGVFEGDFDINAPFRFGVDFNMGDMVDCYLQGRLSIARVVELVRTYSPDGKKTLLSMDFSVNPDFPHIIFTPSN